MICAGGIVVSGLPAFAKRGDIKRVVSARTGASNESCIDTDVGQGR